MRFYGSGVSFAVETNGCLMAITFGGMMCWVGGWVGGWGCVCVVLGSWCCGVWNFVVVLCVVPRMRKRMQRPARNYSVGIASWTTHTQRRKRSARRAAEDTGTAFLIAVTGRTGKYD